MACVDMPGEMVEIGLVAVSCNAVMLVRGVITLLAAGATKSPLLSGLALFSVGTTKHAYSILKQITTYYFYFYNIN